MIYIVKEVSQMNILEVISTNIIMNYFLNNNLYHKTHICCYKSTERMTIN